MLDIVKEAFPHPSYEQNHIVLDCLNPMTTADKLACLWENASTSQSDSLEGQLDSFLKFCKEAQTSLSSTASNYNATKLFGGIAIASIATSLAAFMSLPLLDLTGIWSGYVHVVTSIAYAAMMFASSYVEEEQQFWHWAVASWFTLQLFRW